MNIGSKYKNKTEAVNAVIDKYPLKHKFKSGEFLRDLIRVYPMAKFDKTGVFMRRMRSVKTSKGARKILCIDHAKSIYQKVHN